MQCNGTFQLYSCRTMHVCELFLKELYFETEEKTFSLEVSSLPYEGTFKIYSLACLVEP